MSLNVDSDNKKVKHGTKKGGKKLKENRPTSYGKQSEEKLEIMSNKQLCWKPGLLGQSDK